MINTGRRPPNHHRVNDDPTAEATDFLIDKKRGQKTGAQEDKTATQSNVKGKIGHKGFFQRVLHPNNVTQDSRSQSLPNCLVKEKEQPDSPQEEVVCTNEIEENSAPQSPVSDQWFKTWPERCCDKAKCPESPTFNTQKCGYNCDNLENGNVKNTLTLSEALQSISLAYSPVTKQLHLVESPQNLNQNDQQKDILISDDVDCFVKTGDNLKKGHRRIEAGSFSSTISSLSDPSPSGSLLDADERSVASFDSTTEQTQRNALTDFFQRNVFSSWRSGSSSSPGSRVWKLFTKNAAEATPPSPHRVASSSALILHPR